jgi:hypothetical protein
MFSCLLRRLAASWNAWLTVVLPFLAGVLGFASVIALVIFLGGLVSGLTAAAAAAVLIELVPLAAFAVAAAIVTLLAFFLFDAAVCFVFSRLPQPAPPPPNQPSPLTGDIDCATARRAADEARRRAEQLEQDLAGQAAALRRAQDRLSAARSMVVAAGLGLAASILFPWLLVTALAAVAAATLAAGLAARSLADEESKFTRAAAALARARADLARAEAQAELSCREPPKPQVLAPLAIPAAVMTLVVGVSPPAAVPAKPGVTPSV